MVDGVGVALSNYGSKRNCERALKFYRCGNESKRKSTLYIAAIGSFARGKGFLNLGKMSGSENTMCD